MIENGEELKVIASLLGSTPDMAEKALCYRVVGNKLGAVEKEHTLEQALYGRDAFAKVCVGGGGEENGGRVCVLCVWCRWVGVWGDSLMLHAHVWMCDLFSAGDLRAVVHRNCAENQSSTGGKDHESV